MTKKLIAIGILSMVLASLAGPALAWEAKIKGEAIWRYRFVSRTGMNDIFGYMNGDTGANLGINHVRDYPTPSTNNRFASNRGVIAGEHNFGPDMGLTDYRWTFCPTIKVNKAIKLKASVNFTSLGIHSGGRPYDQVGTAGSVNSLWLPISDRPAASNVPNTYVTVQWAKMSLTTPMLDFSIGYKTSGAGIGLWKNKLDRSSASFGLTAKYGPFKFGTTPYFGRANSNWNRWPRNDRHIMNPWRNEGDRNYFGGVTFFVHYNSGPLSMTLAQEGWHTPNYPDGTYAPRAANGTPQNINNVGRPGEDTWVYDTVVGVKYFNGRFFLNAEASHFWEYNSGRGTADNAGTQVRTGRNQEAWIYGAEGGVIAGPAKLTLSYVRATGDDPNTRITNEDALNGDAGVSPYAMRPWGYLMYYKYGTGFGWNAAGEGQCSNFHHVGARLDYAAAANLNLFGVCSYAWRDQTNAFMFGGDGSHAAMRVTTDEIWDAQTGGTLPDGSPYAVVPESAKHIGYEVDWGFDWKLLENLEWNWTFALWFPGNFWGYAYPNTAAIYNANWPNFVGPDYTLGRENPGRAIDPLFGMQSSLRVHF